MTAADFDWCYEPCYEYPTVECPGCQEVLGAGDICDWCGDGWPPILTAVVLEEYL